MKAYGGLDVLTHVFLSLVQYPVTSLYQAVNNFQAIINCMLRLPEDAVFQNERTVLVLFCVLCMCFTARVWYCLLFFLN
jgi:hypothetical protein